MNELIREFKRHKMFFLFELMVFILIAIIFGLQTEFLQDSFYIITNNADKVRDLEYFGASYRAYRILDNLLQISVFAMIPSVLICTFLRYALQDNRKQRLFKSSVPLSYTTESLFEVLSGIIPIFAVFFLYALLCTFSFDWGEKGLVFSGFSLEYFTYEFFVNEFSIYFTSAIALYLFLVLAKRVSSSTGGIIIFFGLSLCIFYMADFVILLIVKANVPEQLIALPFIIVSVILLVIFDRKLDISKGGTFYFKSVSIVMTVSAGIAFFVMTASFFQNSGENLTAIHIVVSILIGIAVMFAEHYLTRPRIKE